jgi:beta-lactamase superfamily II metal-dependent hydrolase
MSVGLRIWDVQHGSAVHIRTPNGKNIVADCGSGDSGSPLLALKKQLGLARLDMAIITHPHLDHISDILNLSYLNPRTFLRPKQLTRTDILANNKNLSSSAMQIIDEYLRFNSTYTEPLGPGDDPKDQSANGGAKIVTFIPTTCPHTNLNNHSVVAVIEYGGSKILLPGDNEAPSWDELLGRSDFRASISNTDILVAPHHGRDSGFHRELFNHFNPLLTIISDGRFVDTSATDRYGQVTKGWTVHSRSGPDQKRKCVTTRNDGTIDVAIGTNPGGSPFVSVTIG